MRLDFDNHHSINTALFTICSLSPRARRAIDLESYRASASWDEASDQFILDDAVINLISDLGEIGISVDTDYADLTSDLGKLSDFLKLASFLLPEPVYRAMKTNPSLKACLDHILSGDLGDNETVLQAYLSELGGLDDQLPLCSDITDAVDQYYPVLSQTETFTATMRNLQNLLAHERLAIDTDAESHHRYRETIKTVIGRLADAVTLFHGTARYDQLSLLQEQIIRDLIAPMNFIEYHYLFCVDRSTLPDDLQIAWDQKWYHYRVSSPWCPDYFQTRRTTPLPVQLQIMYAFLYSCHPDQASYETEAVALRQLYPAADAERQIMTLFAREDSNTYG